jgi:hypothetical protein
LVFGGMLGHIWWLAAAALIATLILTLIWLWPRQRLGQIAEPAHV